MENKMFEVQEGNISQKIGSSVKSVYLDIQPPSTQSTWPFM